MLLLTEKVVSEGIAGSSMEPSRRLLSKTRESRAVKGERFSSVLKNRGERLKELKKDDENSTSIEY